MPEIFPNFVGDVDQLEFPSSITTSSEHYRIHARNLLRHITRGTGLVAEEGSSYTMSPLAHEDVIGSLFIKRKNELMAALRIEMQAMMDKVFDWISNPTNGDIITREQCDVFLNHILAAYPFFDPQAGEKIDIPTKIDGQWSKVPYTIEQIDISPTKGPLSWVIEDEDRIYAFGLKSSTPGANSHLLLMGTTYPGGQGSALADLYNIKPLHSIGEGHSFTRIGEWVEQQKDHDVIVTGHSKGATMAMIAAIKWPNKIKVAHCFNPAGLSCDTLRRYQDSWVSTLDKPEIKVLINEGDIVPYLDTGYLPGTKIVRISTSTDKLSFNFHFPSFLKFLVKGYEAHIHHFTGRSHTKFENVSIDELNQVPARYVFHDVRWAVSWLLFPLSYFSLFTRIIERKISRFYDNHSAVINFSLLLLGATLATTLVVTGVAPILFGMASNYLLLLNLPIPVVAVKAMATTLVSSLLVAAPLVTTLSASFLIPLAKKISIGISSGVAVVTGVIFGTFSGFVRLGINKLSEPRIEANRSDGTLDKTSHDTLIRSLGVSEEGQKQRSSSDSDMMSVEFLSRSEKQKNAPDIDETLASAFNFTV